MSSCRQICSDVTLLRQTIQKPTVVLGYEFMLIYFSINLVAFSNKTRVCLAGIGYKGMNACIYQGMIEKLLAASTNKSYQPFQ